MKFTSKILAIAVASLAVASVAHAAGPSSPDGGNGSVLLYVWDDSGTTADGDAANQGYILNTGLTYQSLLADIASNTPVTINAGGSATFQSLFSSTAIAAGNVDFSIITGNNDTANPVIISAGSKAPSWQSGQTQVGAVLAYEDASITNVTGTETGLTALVPGNGNYQLYLDQVSQQNDNSQANTLTTSGTTAELYQSVSQPNPGRGKLGNPIVTDTGDSFTLLADGQVNIAGAVSSVPLPAAAWLFGSGLLGLFGVGRRRKIV
jgi:hypothetical protein